MIGDRRGVLHPLWWTSLIVLVVNDHFLKGADLLPGWVTGKLSDFAGLVVAPVCLVALLRLRRTWPRAAAFAVVALTFSAIQLSGSLASTVEAAVHSIGWTCRIWPDPTDLIALPVLFVAWRISTPRRPPRPASPKLRTAAAMAGALACLATSSNGPFPSAAYLVNTTRQTLVVDVHRVPQPIDCDAFEAAPTATVPLDSYELLRRDHLEPFVVTTLDREAPEPHPRVYECDAVLLRSSAFSDSILFWRQENAGEVQDYPPMADAPAPNAVYIERVGDELLLSGDLVRIWKVE